MLGNSSDTVKQYSNPGYTHCLAHMLFIGGVYLMSIYTLNKGKTHRTRVKCSTFNIILEHVTFLSHVHTFTCSYVPFHTFSPYSTPPAPPPPQPRFLLDCSSEKMQNYLKLIGARIMRQEVKQDSPLLPSSSRLLCRIWV